MRHLAGLAAVALVSVLPVGTASEAARAYSFDRIASGLTGAVSVTSAPDDATTLYVTEQDGVIELVRDGSDAGPFLDIRDRVEVGDERGLLSVAFDPAYAQNHLFYVDYTGRGGDIHVVEYGSAGGVAVPSSARELLSIPHPWPNHNGGQLQFDRAGYLWVGTGDGGTDPAASGPSLGDPDNHAESRGSQLGKLLRIDPTRPGAAWQTVGVGLRNPWRFSFDRRTGDLWIGDVGAASYEEIDFRPAARVTKLATYGWSRFEGRVVYNPKVHLLSGAQVVAPIWEYSHSGGVSCAVVGGYVYRGAKVPSARGRYFFGDYCSGAVWTLQRVKNRAVVKKLLLRLPTLSAFGEDAKGELYAVTTNGDLYALR